MTKKFDLQRQGLLPGYEAGHYEPRRHYDRSEFADNLMRRDNRISVRISGRDLSELQKRAMEEGVPYQSLVASIIRKYLEGSLRESPDALPPDSEHD